MQIDMSVYTSRVHIWLCICCISQKYYACLRYPSTDGGWYSMSIYLFYDLFSNLRRIIFPILRDWTWHFMWKIWREAGMHIIFETISASISKIVLYCLGKSVMCTFSHPIEFILCFCEWQENSLSVFWSPRCCTRFDSFNRWTHFGIMWNWLHVSQKFYCLIRLSLSTYETITLC